MPASIAAVGTGTGCWVCNSASSAVTGPRLCGVGKRDSESSTLGALLSVLDGRGDTECWLCSSAVCVEDTASGEPEVPEPVISSTLCSFRAFEAALMCPSLLALLHMQ